MRWSRLLHWFRRPGLMGLGLLLALLLGLSWQPAAMAIMPRHYDELEFPALRDIQIPDFERYELTNGLVVYLMEDHELPLVSGSATFKTGDRLVPGAQTGLGEVTGDAMRLGGTDNYDTDTLNMLLEQRAAAVETSIGNNSGSASFNSLSEDLDEVFGLFADVIRNPAFAPDKLDFVESQYRGSIDRRNDDPDDIASREFRKLVYGGNSHYARTIEYATLDAISRDDIIDFYKASVRPDQTILGIVGDFDPVEMKALIAQSFRDWMAPAGPPPLPAVPSATQANSGVFFVDQPQLTQSYVQMGHLGGMLSTPEHPALAVLNEVLNGFGGRLFNEVRSRQGLAYVVYSFWAARFDYPGTWIGGGQTQSETTVQFIQSMQEELEAIRTTPVGETEQQQAKDADLKCFVFRCYRA